MTYNFNNLEMPIKDFFIKYNLRQPFVILQNKNPRELFTEIIIIGQYSDTLKKIFYDGKNGIYSYPKEYMKDSTITIIKKNGVISPNKNELEQLSFIMFIKEPQSNITQATICFLENGFFILFNHYVNFNK